MSSAKRPAMPDRNANATAYTTHFYHENGDKSKSWRFIVEPGTGIAYCSKHFPVYAGKGATAASRNPLGVGCRRPYDPDGKAGFCNATKQERHTMCTPGCSW